MKGYFAQLMESVQLDELDRRPIRLLRLSQDIWDYLAELDRGKSNFGIESFNFMGIPCVLDAHLEPGYFLKEYVENIRIDPRLANAGSTTKQSKPRLSREREGGAFSL